MKPKDTKDFLSLNEEKDNLRRRFAEIEAMLCSFGTEAGETLIANDVPPLDQLQALHDNLQAEIAQRQAAEAELRVSWRFLEILQQHKEVNSLLTAFVDEVKYYTDCEAVGIRVLYEDGKIPYMAYQGFTKHFYELESPLSIHSDQCMCINVIKGTTDPRLPFYTHCGSFYMNGTTRFLATVSQEDKGQTRNICNQVGYESVALIPIRRGNQILGLIHLADHRENMVPFKMVEMMERSGIQLASAFLRVQAEVALREREEHYRSLFDNMLNGFAYCRMIYEQDQPKDFIYLEVNLAFEALTGLKNVIGKKVSEVIPGIREADPNLFEVYGRVALTGNPERFEMYVEALEMWFAISVYSPRREYFVAVFDVITERKQAEAALRQSEERLRLAQDAAQVGTWEWDLRTNENFWSEELWKLYGLEPYSCSPSYDAWRRTILPDDRAKAEQAVREAVRRGSELNAEWRVGDASGAERWLMSRAQPRSDVDGRVVGYLGIVMDITERKQAEIALSDSLAEKVVLLKEVHHRVKNNLQIVASLLNLQASRSHNPEVVDLLQDTRNRVHSMALLHEVLYQSDNLARINFAAYVDDLCCQLLRSFGTQAGRVKIENRVARIGMPLDQSVPCGLIINELVSNALKHAFPGEGSGKIRVEMGLSQDQQLMLCVKDNGIGLPIGLDITDPARLGLRLITSLAEQLEGKLTVEQPDGTGVAFTMIFPLPEDALVED